MTCALAMLPMVAWAEPDTFFLGDGHSGSKTITTPGTIVNSYGVLAASSQPGDTSLVVRSTTGFSAADLVMVLQTTGLSVIPASGDPSPTDISSSPTAHWELARVASVDATAGRIVLTAPMFTAFTALVSQVITVPEYTDVTINSGASIIASAWTLANGGGVIAFLVKGLIVNNGSISADKAGFRGGGYLDDPGFLTTSTGCSGLDDPPPKNAQKGEGLADARYGPGLTGRGNVANGAGGGICQGSGGGGGGNFGKGGPGGFSHDGARPVGGLGGTSVVYSLLDHLSLGGGGGAGHGGLPANQGAPGGAGGGAIFIRATAVTGNSLITAAGETAPRSDGGGGGGGAGGSIYLRFAATVACGSAAIQASGGNGSTITGAGYGPGGGGGGGRILLQHGDPTLACTRVYVDAGFGGTQDGGSFYGSGPSNPTSAPFVGMVVVMDGGFISPLVPVITQPLDGAILQQTRPQIIGTGASPGSTAIIYLDGLEVGRTTVDSRGNFSYQSSSDWSLGTHVVQAASEHDGVQSAKSDPVTFTIVLPDGGTGDDGGSSDDGGGSGDGGGDLPRGHFGGGGCSAANSGALWWVLGTVLISCLVLRRVPRLGRR